MRDNSQNIKIDQSIAPAVQTATVTGTSSDLANFNSATAIIDTGAIAGSGNFTAKLQDSSDNSTFADVAGKYLVGTLPTALTANSVVKQGYLGTQRYLRVVVTLNSGTSIVAGASIVKGDPRTAPTT